MSVTVQSVVNQNGHAVITFVDHLGQGYTETLFVPEGWSPEQLNAHAAVRAAALAGSLADGEALEIVQ